MYAYVHVTDSALVQCSCDMQVLDQVADEKSLIIAVGYMLRSSPAVVAAKQLMKEVGCFPIVQSLAGLWITS